MSDETACGRTDLPRDSGMICAGCGREASEHRGPQAAAEADAAGGRVSDMLGPQPTWRDSHNGCTYNPDPMRSPAGDCRKPPTLHISLRDDLGSVGACAEHQTFALANLPVDEWHDWAAWCNMPGSLWHPSPTPDEADSWCSLDDGAEEPALAATAEATL